jgi:hypothetical protein
VSTLYPQGISLIEHTGAPSAKYLQVTIPIAESSARSGLAVVAESVETVGTFSMRCNNCATYAASVSNATGVALPRLTSPLLNYMLTLAQTQPVVSTITRATTAASATNLGVTIIEGAGQNSTAPTPPPPPKVESKAVEEEPSQSTVEPGRRRRSTLGISKSL